MLRIALACLMLSALSIAAPADTIERPCKAYLFGSTGCDAGSNLSEADRTKMRVIGTFRINWPRKGGNGEAGDIGNVTTGNDSRSAAAWSGGEANKR